MPRTPEQNERIAELQADLKETKSLDTLARSDGGKILVAALLEDIVSVIEVMTADPGKHTLQEFVAFAVKLKEKIDLTRVITRSKSNRKFLEEELKRALKEAGEGED